MKSPEGYQVHRNMYNKPVTWKLRTLRRTYTLREDDDIFSLMNQRNTYEQIKIFFRKLLPISLMDKWIINGSNSFS